MNARVSRCALLCLAGVWLVALGGCQSGEKDSEPSIYELEAQQGLIVLADLEWSDAALVHDLAEDRIKSLGVSLGLAPCGEDSARSPEPAGLAWKEFEAADKAHVVNTVSSYDSETAADEAMTALLYQLESSPSCLADSTIHEEWRSNTLWFREPQGDDMKGYGLTPTDDSEAYSGRVFILRRGPLVSTIFMHGTDAAYLELMRFPDLVDGHLQTAMRRYAGMRPTPAVTPTPPLSVDAGDLVRLADLDESELQRMLPQGDELPYQLAIPVGTEPKRVTNAEAAVWSFDPSDTEWDFLNRGRLIGYERQFTTPLDSDVETKIGTHAIQLVVTAWDSERSAAEEVRRERADASRYIGTDNEGYVLRDARTYPAPDLGGEEYVAWYALSEAVLGDVYAYEVVFQHQNVVAMASLTRMDDSNATAEVESLARILRAQIDEVTSPQALPPHSDAEDARPAGALGLRCSYATAYLRDRYNLEAGRGCVVLRVRSDSAASRAGVEVGDKIVSMNGVRITSGQQFTVQWNELESAAVDLDLERREQRFSARLELSASGGPSVADPFPEYLAARGNPDRQAAISLYTEAIHFAPGFELPLLYRAQLRFEAGPYGDPLNEAIADVEHVLTLDPDLTEAHVTLGRMYGASLRYDEAITHLDRAAGFAGCVGPVEGWDLDCAEIRLTRAQLMVLRRAPGDIDRVALDVNDLKALTDPDIVKLVYQLELDLAFAR